MYFDLINSICLPKNNEYIPCTESAQCLGDLVCSSGTCQCPNTINQYYDSTQLKCFNKTLNGVSCFSNITCR
jgi:hypothetical protein